MNAYKHYLIVPVLLLSILFAPIRPVHAFWNDPYTQELFAQYLDVAWDKFKGALLGSLKAAAYKTIATKVSSLINGGDSGQARFITDWEDYLYGAAKRETTVVINDFFTSVFNGASSSGYISSSAQLSGSATASIPFTNYATYLEQSVKKSIGIETNKDTNKFTLNNYCSDPSKMFSEGNWQCVNAYFSNISYNSVYGLKETVEKKRYNELGKQVQQNITQAVAYQGFKAVKDKLDSDLVSTPGSIVASVQKSLYDAILQVPGNASNPWELIELSAATFVNGFITDLFNQAAAQVSNTVNTVVDEGVDAIADQIGDAEVGFSSVFNSVSESSTGQGKWSITGTGGTTP